MYRFDLYSLSMCLVNILCNVKRFYCDLNFYEGYVWFDWFMKFKLCVCVDCNCGFGLFRNFVFRGVEVVICFGN